MGMYDSIMMKVKCPKCGENIVRELQTKELDCVLNVYNVGDYIDKSEKDIQCIAECESEKCLDKTKNGGFGVGHFFYVNITLKKGFINGRYKILENV